MAYNSEVDKIDREIQYVTERINRGKERLEDEQKEQKELEKELDELKIAREEAIKKGPQMSGFGMFLCAFFVTAIHAAADAYCRLPKERQEELDKQVAKDMFDKAVQGKLTEPYTGIEVEFMMEHLK